LEACLATVLNLKLHEVPTFSKQEGDWIINVNKWLGEKGLAIIIGPNLLNFLASDCKISNLEYLIIMKDRNSKYDDYAHICLGNDDKITFDPTPEEVIKQRSGPLEAFKYGFFINTSFNNINF